MALPFTPIPHEEQSFESMIQSTTVKVSPDVESLPESDDEGLAMVQDPQAELLHWHQQLNHLAVRVLQTLAKLGLLSKRQSTVMPQNVLHAFMVLLTSNHDKCEF